MVKTYVSPSLLDAFCNSYDWIGMIKREPREVTQSMENGNIFEKAVIDGEFEELNDLVDNCLYQEFCCGQVGEFFLLGFADIIKNNLIVDLKFKSNYEYGQYYNSNQRLIYTALLNIDNFAYVVGTGSNPHEPTGIYWEYYKRNDDLLLERLYSFDKAIDTCGLRSIYEQNYNIGRYKDQIEQYIQW